MFSRLVTLLIVTTTLGASPSIPGKTPSTGPLVLPAIPQLVDPEVQQVMIDAEKGDAEAQSKVGMMFFFGDGVKKDLKKAYFWFTKAGEQGVPDAQTKLGCMFFMGLGVPRNFEKAIAWFKKAAEQGEIHAMGCLGILYAVGSVELPRDLVQAYRWLSLARIAGDKDVLNALGQVVMRLTKEQRDLGDHLVSETLEGFKN